MPPSLTLLISKVKRERERKKKPAQETQDISEAAARRD